MRFSDTAPKEAPQEPMSHLRHEAAGLRMQQLGLGAGVEQEGEGAEGEGPIHRLAMVGGVMRLPPRHVVVLHIQLLTAPSFS